eukprot:Anaeramoba_flamelloidesa86839_221.p1 GENE.a86839_221~~a86839_221.p1  ORF type:complete len:477 (-),score=94.12 a86839_221:49-1458(-)
MRLTFALLITILLLKTVLSIQPHHVWHAESDDRIDENSVDVRWLTQKLDHFNAQDTRTFQQRYYVNATWYKPGVGPIFLSLGGEGELTSKWIQSGQCVDLAKEYGALVLGLEHRYYGKSQPFAELPVENLRYLSSQQALGDVATLYEEAMTNFGLDPDKTTWVSFGCSYSGALSLWLREKFPFMIDGAFSGSSPVLANKEYIEYDETCEDSVGYSCMNHLVLAFDEIKTLLATNSGKETLSQKFNLCQALDSDYWVNMFKYNIIGVIQGSVQYNNAPRGFPRVEMCRRLARASNKFEEYVKLTNEMNGGLCFDLSLNSVVNQTAAPENNGRTWWWQKATEFAYYKNSPEGSDIFFPEIDLEFHNKVAEEIFGQPLKPHVEFTNSYYGAKSPVVSDVIITNGLYDPWSRLSILTDMPNNVQSVLYTSSGHCAPVYPLITEGPDPTPEDVLLAREKVKDFIQTVIDKKSSQ